MDIGERERERKSEDLHVVNEGSRRMNTIESRGHDSLRGKVLGRLIGSLRDKRTRT